MDARSISSVLAGFGLALALAGCNAPQRDTGARPADFSLDALVLNPRTGDPPPPRWRRQARYVVGADGELRVALGAGVNDKTIPRRTRTLDQAQLDRVWSLASEAGLTDPGGDRVIGWGQTWEGPRGEPSAVISVRGHGRRVHSGVPLGASSGLGAPRVEALLDELGELAWAPEE